MARSHLLWLMLAIVTPSGVTAQVVRGTVRADSTGNPIAGADVWLQGTLSRVRTDRTGRYRVAALKPDSYHLVVRAVGFRPLEIDAVLAAADSIETDLVLTPLAIELAPLEVSAAAPPRLSARMRGFEEHRATGLGRFFTRLDLAKWDHGTVTGALRSVAGLSLVPLPCSAGYAVASGRGRADLRDRPLTCRGVQGIFTYPRACYLTIYVDGVRIWTWGDETPPNMEEIQAMSLEAIEIYRGPSELPIQYQTTGSACGAVLFWTREK